MGHATALHLQQAGYQVFAGARRVERMADLAACGIDIHVLDVTDTQSNQTFIDHVLRTAGRIDVLINNAGYGSFGAIEDVPIAEAQRRLSHTSRRAHLYPHQMKYLANVVQTWWKYF